MSDQSTILITGSAVRLGRELAYGLGKQGYAIAVHSHSHHKEASTLVQDLKNKGIVCAHFSADLSDVNQAQNLIKDVHQTLPKLQTVINCAAIIKQASLLDTSPQDFDMLFDLNLKAPFFMTQAFAKICKQGHVINILDTYITKKRTPYFAYLLSKKALAAFTQMAAFELGPHIRVNGICPGLVIPASWQDPSLCQRKQQQLPLEQLPKPEDIVQTVDMLLQNSHITGQLVFIDGGEHLL